MELFQEKLYRLARLQPILDEYKAEQLIQVSIHSTRTYKLIYNHLHNCGKFYLNDALNQLKLLTNRKQKQ